MDKTIDKINNYLQVGGLFNPELMEHHKVSDLLLECRNELTKANAENERLRAALERIRDVKPSWGAESEEMYEIARAALENTNEKV